MLRSCSISSPFCALLAHRAWNPPPSSSLPEEERRCSLLLHAAARDSRRSQRPFVRCSRIALGIRRRRRRSQRKNASARSFSVRRRAIRRRSRQGNSYIGPVTVSPFGSWVSPVSVDQLIGPARLSAVQIDGRHIYWLDVR